MKKRVMGFYYIIFFAIAIMAGGCSTSDSSDNEVIDIVDTGDIDSTPSFEDDFNSIDSSVWQVASWQEESLTSPLRCVVSNGILNMTFRYDSATGTNLGAAIQTWNTFLYGRWEARLKPSSISGVLNSMYTIDWGNGNGTKQEIDIEFLTFAFGTGTGKVHFAVHAAGLASTNTNPDISLGFNPSDDFHVYGFEITPQHIAWIVDGTVMYTYTYSGNAITINSPYQLKFNVWSSVNWVQGPPVADTDCIYQIDWVKFYPYVAD